ncbi:hypothetical protein ABW19_dt0205512 [Dactylella cylindrospora]|nr:hypothetical protein ABW19_dt0205512 [Dactylella cylindrospora]
MAPLGLLTAVVSVIRVRGSASMRAFIGRAQESQGVAEAEILSCTSETTAELFNEGGIARVFGEPRILEVVVISSEDIPGKIRIERFAEAGKAWERVGRGGRGFALSPEIENNFINHNPNLSLNLGIIRRSPVLTYLAAALGITLQSRKYYLYIGA